MELLDKDKEFLDKYESLYFPTDTTILFYVFMWLLTVVSALGLCSLLENIRGMIVVYFITTILFISPIFVILVHQKRKKIFLKKYGINKIEASNYYQFLTKEIIYAPLLQRVCQMNPDAKERQIELLGKWFSLDDDSILEYIFNKKYNDNEEEYDDEDDEEKGKNNPMKQLKEEDISYKRTFINRLFQLVILEDGIHNDEWKLMMRLITQLEFNKHYINYFKERYEPLRTEFDEYEKRSNSSKNKYVYSLKEYYTTLGLEENASYEEVRRAYHELALQHHPDLPKNASRIEECEKMMMKINEAYEKLRSKS